MNFDICILKKPWISISENCRIIATLNNFAYVAFDGEHLLGTFSLRKCDLPSHVHYSPWLGGVIVPKNIRNQGIGTLLVKEGEKQAKDRGYNQLFLLTFNKASWYAKLGWSTKEESFLFNIPITIMDKCLK